MQNLEARLEEQSINQRAQMDVLEKSDPGLERKLEEQTISQGAQVDVFEKTDPGLDPHNWTTWKKMYR
jgi:hypothetical protein